MLSIAYKQPRCEVGAVLVANIYKSLYGVSNMNPVRNRGRVPSEARVVCNMYLMIEIDDLLWPLTGRA